MERAYTQRGFAEREWGPAAGRRYIQRINELRAAESVAELYSLAGAYLHSLTGNRSGQSAMRLHGLLRLILTIDEREPSVIVVEVVDYHG